MPTIQEIEDLKTEMTAWRRQLHSQPETAFEEVATSEFVAGKLREFGLEIHRGLAGTGVVGTLSAGTGNRAVGLRADMDALDIQERNTFGYASTVPGKMHACGHDGHVTMLLGAARYLAGTRRFNGTVRFIFQPAEENEGGGRVMVEQGLFDTFPVDAVYALHNWPGMAAGKFGVRRGPIMASFDIFEISVTGRSCHAAMPHLGRDPIQCAAKLVDSLQVFVAREFSAFDAAVISVTQIHGGDTWNVIPDQVVLRGTARALKSEVRDAIEEGMKRIVEHVGAEHVCTTALRYERRYPPTINTADEVEEAIAAMSDVVGRDNVADDAGPSMGAEDFAFLLNARPGAYAFVGNGEQCAPLHNSSYDFNDDILPIGASYFARLAERLLV
jgi:amidohydrolase